MSNTSIASDSAPTTHAATAVATRADTPIARAVGGVISWDPFALMDRLDADAFVAEMQGIASDVLVYAIKDGKKEPTYGLSKGGIDECCTMLVSQGQCIREESIKVEYFGDGEDKEALFTATVARYAVHPDGREVRLDQVLGVKREPLYEARAPLTLDSKVAGRKWRHLTYGEALENDEALDYLEWVRDASSFDDDTKKFIALLLDGADVREFSLGKRFNPFWYEHGCMKAARNGRSRMIPAGLRAQVIAMAKGSAAAEAGRSKVKVVERAETSDAEPTRENGNGTGGDGGRTARAKRREPDAPATTPANTAPANAPTDVSGSAPAADATPTPSRREPSRTGWKFPFAPRKGVLLDTLVVDADTGAVTGYEVSDGLLRRALAWALDMLAGKPYERPDGERKPITVEERPRFENTVKALEYELEARRLEAEDAAMARAARVPGGETSDDVGGAGASAPPHPTPAGGGNSGVTDTGNVSSATDASGGGAGLTTNTTTILLDGTATTKAATPTTADGLAINDDDEDPIPF